MPAELKVIIRIVKTVDVNLNPFVLSILKSYTFQNLKLLFKHKITKTIGKITKALFQPAKPKINK
jgi:hypothetical protein